MDQLFFMKRYWASDEEDSTEENISSKCLSESKKSRKKQKLDLSLNNGEIKKDWLFDEEPSQPVVTQIKSESDSEKYRNIPFDELKSDLSANECKGDIWGTAGHYIPFENIKTKAHKGIIDTGNKIIPKVVASPMKLGQSNATSEKHDVMVNVSSLTENSVNSSKEGIEGDGEIKTKYRTLKQSELLENNKSNSPMKLRQSNATSEKHDVMVNVSGLTENSVKITSSKEGIEGDGESKTKKQTLKPSELLENNKSNSLKKVNSAAISKPPAIGNVKNKTKTKKNRVSKLEEGNEKTDPHEHDSSTQEAENIGQGFSTIGQVYQPKDETVKHALPQWLCNPTYISVSLQEEKTPVSELNYLDINTKSNLKIASIDFLFPVQQAVIPWLMQSKEQSLLIRPSDICVSAPTGSGKTLAFVLPIVQSLKDRIVCSVRALIVLPVSELAIQVFKVFETFIVGTDLKIALLTGKKSFVAEQNALVKSNGQSVQSLVDIVVTTPGRVNDHIYRTKGFCLKRLRYLVIDEADRMMEEIQEGWLKQVEDAVFQDCVFSNCVCSSYKRTLYEPTSAYNFGFVSQPLQKLLYSATLTHDPEQLHNLSLYKPKLFTASSSGTVAHKGMSTIPSELKMLQVTCDEGIKPLIICHLVKCYDLKKVLCFTETVERAHRLHLVLKEMGLLQVREVSSLNRAVQRKIVLEQFTYGKVSVLVCSDLVARGIDIKNIDCVISYDVPRHVKTYIHRIGRTARAGKTGTAITLLSEAEVPVFEKMLNPAGIKVPEKVRVNSEHLEPFVDSYQKALSIVDVELKKEKKKQLSSRASKNTKRKLE